MTPAQADQILNSLGTMANPCGTLHELLDVMAENPTLYAAQIARACGYITTYGCAPHTACGSES